MHKMPNFDLEIPWGLIDEIIQGYPLWAKVVTVLFINNNHFCHIRKGSNMKAKLTTLWTLLYFTRKKGIWKLKVMGDSKVSID